MNEVELSFSGTTLINTRSDLNKRWMEGPMEDDLFENIVTL